MNNLELQFLVRFDSHRISFSPYGPLTHRMMPDGEADSIQLDVGNADFELKIWFERRGIMNGNQIEFKLDEHNVDENEIGKHGLLDIGPLTCRLILKNIPQEEFDVIIKNRINDVQYIAFTKRFLKLILPTLNNFIQKLRIKHGQYWLNDIKNFDSRYQSLGNYCKNLQMKWREIGNIDWFDFQPTNLMIQFDSIVQSDENFITDYITHDDWQKIKQEKDVQLDSTLAMDLLVESWKNFDQGDISKSIISGITSLELSLEQVIRTGLSKFDLTYDKIDDFKKSKFDTKLTVIASLRDDISKTELENSLEVYSIRNKIVHDGEEPPTNMFPKLKSLLDVVSKLTLSHEFKSPMVNSGNVIMDEVKWDALTSKIQS